MNNKILFFITILIACFFCSTVSAQVKDWYFGYGIGSGSGWLDSQSYSYTGFNDLFGKTGDANGWGSHTDDLAITGNLGIGLIITDRLHIGFELSSFQQGTEYHDGPSYTIDIFNFYLAGSFYPWENGLSFKTALGYNTFTEEISITGSGDHTSKGYGGLIGVGYDFNYISSCYLGFHIDYIIQRYNENGPVTVSLVNIYVSLYWF